MGYRIEDHHEQYLKIIMDGLMDKKTALAAMEALVSHPDFYKKHSFWDFTAARMGLSLQDLKEITGVMKLFKPAQEKFADKSAMLVSGRMNLAMANVFVAISKLLPFRYKTFSDPEKAAAYLSA